MRRQVPIVMLGGGSEWAKLPSVTPDYGDAGYRAAEHFARLGCGEIAVVTSAARTREAELVLSGLRSGGQRQGVETTDLTLGSPEGLVELMARWSRGTARRTKDASADRVGVLVVGGAAAEWLTSHPTWPAARAARADAACILEPGDARAASWGLSAYEVDVQRMAQLAARLLADLRAGQVPTEWIVPGRWVVRGAGTREHRGHDEPGERQRLASQASDYCESVS